MGRDLPPPSCHLLPLQAARETRLNELLLKQRGRPHHAKSKSHPAHYRHVALRVAESPCISHRHRQCRGEKRASTPLAAYTEGMIQPAYKRAPWGWVAGEGNQPDQYPNKQVLPGAMGRPGSTSTETHRWWGGHRNRNQRDRHTQGYTSRRCSHGLHEPQKPPRKSGEPG